jgi:hypothetical protein
MQAERYIAVILFGILSTSLAAEQNNCSEIAAIAKMARSRSPETLRVAKQEAGESYRSQLVFAARLLELNPTDRDTAKSLLEQIPKNEAQELVLMTLGDSLCDAEPMQEMKSLGRLGERIPRDLATAVLRLPAKMEAYVAYGYQAAQDPHNDYVLQMQRVCQINHAAFLGAVARLGEGSSQGPDLPIPSSSTFRTQILNPENCRALVLPEAN